jgi:hypothetical protein
MASDGNEKVHQTQKMNEAAQCSDIDPSSFDLTTKQTKQRIKTKKLLQNNIRLN